ncbi:MAG TPA: SusD/RagB family nutrient-binding outer membrane lipoprotein [Flavitalea sp.]|nr:SusD/RagB family nutrient-binding outer membrane lipoprotein [Flavitalea sp.]
MIRKIFAVLSLFVALGSCTKDFENINVDPTKPATVPLDYLLGQTEMMIAGSAGDPGYHTWRANLIYALPISQQFATLGTFYAGDKYLYQADLSEALFVTAYPNAIKNLVNLIEVGKDKPEEVNTISLARILKAFQFSMITDIYGDVPYFEAGRGFYDRNFQPQYDEQQAIYMDILNELDQAGDAITDAQPFPSAADFVYRGDAAKWKIFANTLMLRLAMRLTKADPGAAQSWVTKAIGKGVMSSNDETFAFIHDGSTVNSANANSYNLGPDGPEAGRKEVIKGSIQWSKTLVDLMKGRNDPRLPIIATLNDPASSVPNLTDGDHSLANAKGLPNGLDGSRLSALTGENDALKYSRPRGVIFNADDPNMFLTHAEARFLTAEAIARGWVSGDDAAEYKAGQEAAIKQMEGYKPDNPATAQQITDYLAANPYPTGSLDAKMVEIENEMFILTASTLNGYEAWANIRRTGLPALTPTNFPGNQTGGTLPHRLRFPGAEAGVNPNYATAIGRMGADDFNTRVWWDK